MPKQEPKQKAVYEEDGQNTERFTDTMRKLLAVPKEDMARREEEYRKAHPKKAKPAKNSP